MRRNIRTDTNGSVIPIILFVLAIVVCGALYTLFFIEVGFDVLDMLPVPSSPGKSFIMMMIYAIPLIVLIVGAIALLLEGLKTSAGWIQ